MGSTRELKRRQHNSRDQSQTHCWKFALRNGWSPLQKRSKEATNAPPGERTLFAFRSFTAAKAVCSHYLALYQRSANLPKLHSVRSVRNSGAHQNLQIGRLIVLRSKRKQQFNLQASNRGYTSRGPRNRSQKRNCQAGREGMGACKFGSTGERTPRPTRQDETRGETSRCTIRSSSVPSVTAAIAKCAFALYKLETSIMKQSE